MSTSTVAGTAAAQPAFLSKERIIAKPGFNRGLVPPAALAIHGLVVWTKLSRHGFYDRMVERERAALERTQAASPADPW